MTDAPGIKDPPQKLWDILKSIGPGLILTANIVGTGELIATTRLGSQVGFILLWFIIFACCIKVFVQVELGRYTISEGVSSLEILRRLPTFGRFRWAIVLWFFMYVGTMFQMAAMVGGVAELFARSQDWRSTLPWALGAAAVAAGLLWINRYKLIETASTFMVVAFTLINLLAVGIMQFTVHKVTGADLVEGFSFRFPPSLMTAFAVFGITGVGAAELMFYPIWCLEKGYARAVGPRDNTLAWETRAKGWLRVMRWDAWLSMVVYTVGTVSFYLLGAALLARQGKVVGDTNPMDTLQEMYTMTFGSAGVWIFVVGAFMVLYSTYFVSTASNARLFADVSGMMGFHKTPEERAKWVRWAVVGIPVLTLILYYGLKAPVTLVMIGGTAQALMLPFLGFAALWFHRKVPASIRAGVPWVAFLVLSVLAMATLGGFQAAKAVGLVK
ncbi:MAG TPA: Nramp family divalent metal transporter [Planctomycetota bacterium]